MGKSKEVLGTQLSHEQRQRCGEILQTIWGIRGQQEHQNIDLRFFHSWQQGDRYGRESGWRGSCAKASPKRFCDQLNVVICGWKYGTVLRPHACGCQHHPYHSYVHRFWERTCKGTFQGSSQRTLQGFPITIHGAEKLDTLAEIPEPKKKPAKKTLGELILAKCYPYEIAWHTRQPKEPKRARSSCSEKKEPENPSGGVNSYLVLGVEGLAVSRIGRLLSARGHYGHPPVNPSLKWPRARARTKAQAQAKLFA